MSNTRKDHIESTSSTEKDEDESYIIHGSRLPNSLTPKKPQPIGKVDCNNLQSDDSRYAVFKNIPIEEFMKIPLEELRLMLPDQDKSKPFFKEIDVLSPSEMDEIIVDTENNHHLAKSNKSSASPHSNSISTKFSSNKNSIFKKIEFTNQRASSYFYDESSDSYGFTRYNNDENLLDTGCQFYWIKPGSYREYSLPQHPYNDKAYIFIESKNQLLYGKGNQFEEIKINDLSKFKEIFKNIMDNEYRYEYKHITYEEINKLITLNSGHMPDINNFIESDSVKINFEQ